MPRLPYVVAAAIRGAPLAHAWGEAERAQSLGDGNRRLDRKLQGITLRGLLVLSGALVAWMAERFDDLTPSSQRLAHLADALWAANLDRGWLDATAVMQGGHAADDRVEAPINRAFDHVGTIIELFDEGENAIVDYVAALAHTVRIVVPARTAFDTWFNAAVQRLARLAPRTDPIDADEDDYDDPALVAGMYGAALPWAVVDPGGPDALPGLGEATMEVAQQSAAGNPFLRRAARSTDARS